MTPVGCAAGPPITGQLNLEGIPVLGLVDTGASVTCMGLSMWWQYRTQWGPLKPFEGVVHGAHGKLLQIAGKTQHLNLHWDEARGRACFIVIIGLESPPVLIGMDIMRLLHVHIDVTNSTVTPAQPDPQTIHLNAAQQQDLPPTSHALLLQTTDIPAKTAQLVRCHYPWPSEDVYFCPENVLPTFVSGVPALSSGSEVWVAIHNHRPEPLRLHSGQNVGTLEVVAVADSQPPPAASKSLCQSPIPEHLSPIQQQQLKDLFKEFSNIISQGEDDLGCTPLLQHTIETKGPPLRQPYRRQNPVVRRKEMEQVQQMLTSGVICPSNSPWASPVVMVKKKDSSHHFCVDFRQLNVATIKDAHPLPRIDDLLDALHGARWFSTLDLKSGYWQVPIMERDKEKIAFRTSGGQIFEFNQVPFGLCNTPATFSRLMDRILSGLHWETRLFYLDNIIVFAASWEEHLNRLRYVFERLRHAKLKLGTEKCTFTAKGGQLPGTSSNQRRPPAQSIAPDSYPGDPASQKSHGGPLFPGSHRLLPAICQKFRSHRRPAACFDPERCGLPQELRMSGRLRLPQNTPHYQPHHRLPRLQLAFPSLLGSVDCRPRRNPHSSPGRKGAYHLLCISLP